MFVLSVALITGEELIITRGNEVRELSLRTHLLAPCQNDYALSRDITLSVTYTCYKFIE